jgi:uncharacterized protein (DUF1501 family)
MTFTRRTFLCGTTATALSVPAFMRSLAAEAAGNVTLVSILLDGGCDGLNTVVPLNQYGIYSQLRKIPGTNTFLSVLESDVAAAGTAFESNYTVPAANAVNYAFHPNMTALRALYGTGKVAVVFGVGLPPADRNRTSHEVAKFDWASGSINKLGYSNLGWLGQTFDVIGGGGALPPTVSLNYTSPTILRGAKTHPLVLGGDIGGFTVPCGSAGADCITRLGALATNDTLAAPDLGAEFARALATDTTTFVKTVNQYATAVTGADYPAPGKSSLKSQLKQVARLIRAGSPSRAYFASQGGYDTHSQQNAVGSHPDLLKELSEALTDFYGYLAANALSQNVVIMTYSDFGRRVQANSTAGTDHGTASVAFVIGDLVKPGIFGQYPDLTKLDNTGNPIIQVDFRNHLSDLITALGADPTPIVGSSYPKLGFI